MGNQFSIQPASGTGAMREVMGGMRSLIDSKVEVAENKKKQKEKEDFTNLILSGDTEAVRKAAMLRPDLAKEVQGGDKARHDIIKQRRADMAVEGLMGQKSYTNAAIDYTEKAQSEGRDTTEGLSLARTAGEGEVDPEKAEKTKKAFEMALALNGTKEQWDQYQETKGEGGELETKPYSPTGEDRYVEDKGNEWLANNPGATEVPAGLGAKWRLEHKRAQKDEVAATASAKKTAELDVIKRMQPGIARDTAIATYQAKSEEERGQKIINTGLEAAEGMANLRRGIELLETIETGGYANISLATKRFFGAEGADEGELSYRLSRKVLAQLKETFGAQFTEGESAKLERIESNFSKSPANNKRLLNQALRMSQRKVNSARKYASRKGDKTTVEELDEWSNFSLSTDISGLPEGVTEEDITTTMELRGMTREQVLTKLGAK